MEASVVIIAKNQKTYLEQTLPMLKAQSTPCEIIVVDSGSTDGAREYCLKQKVKLVDFSKEKFNYARAFNVGAAKAQGKYLVRLSGDCVPQDRDWLQAMLEPFADPKVGGTFGKYVGTGRKGYSYPDYWPEWRFPKTLKRYSVNPSYFMGLNFFGISVSPSLWEFAGGCCAIRKAIWDKRPFNELLISGEDGEYSWFLHQIGYDIVCNPRATVTHEHKIDRLKSIVNYTGLTGWGMTFQKVMWTYWINRILGKDPYREMTFKEAKPMKGSN